MPRKTPTRVEAKIHADGFHVYRYKSLLTGRISWGVTILATCDDFAEFPTKAAATAKGREQVNQP